MRAARVTCSWSRDPSGGPPPDWRCCKANSPPPVAHPAWVDAQLSPRPRLAEGTAARRPGSSLRRRRQRRALGRRRADRGREQLWSGVLVGLGAGRPGVAPTPGCRRVGPWPWRAARTSSCWLAAPPRADRTAPDGLAGRAGAAFSCRAPGAGTRRTIAHRPGMARCSRIRCPGHCISTELRMGSGARRLWPVESRPWRDRRPVGGGLRSRGREELDSGPSGRSAVGMAPEWRAGWRTTLIRRAAMTTLSLTMSARLSPERRRRSTRRRRTGSGRRSSIRDQPVRPGPRPCRGRPTANGRGLSATPGQPVPAGLRGCGLQCAGRRPERQAEACSAGPSPSGCSSGCSRPRCWWSPAWASVRPRTRRTPDELVRGLGVTSIAAQSINQAAQDSVVGPLGGADPRRHLPLHHVGRPGEGALRGACPGLARPGPEDQAQAPRRR